MSNVAIIPARGGSKRIPRKNVKNFAGIPLVARTIQAAVDSEIYDSIIVSTDDEEIIDISSEFHVIVHRRTYDLANDFASLYDVVSNVLQDVDCKMFTCILPSNPFISPNWLKNGFELYNKNTSDSVISVVELPVTLEKILGISEGFVQRLDAKFGQRTQDQTLGYYDAGMFYMVRKSTFDSSSDGRLSCGNIVPLTIPTECTHDIDTPQDWDIALRKFKNL